MSTASTSPPSSAACRTFWPCARRSIVEPFSLIPPGGSEDLAAATGWSGDGAPGHGSLREFAIGAIADHLPKTLRRRAGIDYRVPTQAELRALEAFLLSLGRQEDIDISNSTGQAFASDLVERGRALFNNELSGSCTFCHEGAGGLNEGGFNGMFDTGVARLEDAPARRLRPKLPGDGGFGSSPKVDVAGRPGYGDGRMNTPTLVEAADTAPFFHNNAAATLEDAVRFYTTDTFANSSDGQARPTIDLAPDDIVAIGALCAPSTRSRTSAAAVPFGGLGSPMLSRSTEGADFIRLGEVVVILEMHRQGLVGIRDRA